MNTNTRLFIISVSVLLRMINVSDKSCRENQNIHFVFSNVFSKIVSFMGYVEKYRTARQTTDDNTLWRMGFACWIPKATNTHSQYVLLITFPLQQLLCERVSLLRYTYFACPVMRLPRSFGEIRGLFVSTALQTSCLTHDYCDKFRCQPFVSSFSIVLLIIDLPQYTACTLQDSFPWISMQICQG